MIAAGPSSPLNAFTVDVEDYFQVSAFEHHVAREHWGQYESRVESGTHEILDLLDEAGTKGTFFVLGWMARHRPHLVREIAGRGHEIGSHSFWHRLVYSQTPEDFRQDLREVRDTLQDIIGEPVRVHRSPSFSITRKSLWALEILVEEGFVVDSSIFPIHHDRYGIPDADPSLHQRQTASGPIWEFPMPVVRCCGMNLPVGGGGYFRLYPLPLTLHWLGRINRKYRRSFVFFVHPWELDPGQPRIRSASWMNRTRHRVNLSTTRRKLKALLGTFRFGRLGDCLPGGSLQPVQAEEGIP